MPCEGFMSFGPYEKLSLRECSNIKIFASSHIQISILPPEAEFHVFLTNIYQCMP